MHGETVKFSFFRLFTKYFDHKFCV